MKKNAIDRMQLTKRGFSMTKFLLKLFALVITLLLSFAGGVLISEEDRKWTIATNDMDQIRSLDKASLIIKQVSVLDKVYGVEGVVVQTELGDAVFSNFEEFEEFQTAIRKNPGRCAVKYDIIRKDKNWRETMFNVRGERRTKLILIKSITFYQDDVADLKNIANNNSKHYKKIEWRFAKDFLAKQNLHPQYEYPEREVRLANFLHAGWPGAFDKPE